MCFERVSGSSYYRTVTLGRKEKNKFKTTNDKRAMLGDRESAWSMGRNILRGARVPATAHRGDRTRAKEKHSGIQVWGQRGSRPPS